MMVRTLLLLAIVAADASAHGLVDDQINQLTLSIGRNSENAALYVKRGELHRQHRDWESALADFDRAIHLDPGAAVAALGRARVAIDRGLLADAERLLDNFLASGPASEVGLVLRAEVRDRLGRFNAAASDYAAAIRISRDPRIEYYLGQAESLSRANEDEAAQAAADAGIARLGQLAVLEQWSIESLVRQRRWDEALSRLDRMLSEAPRKETGLTRRAEVLASAGRVSEARTAFEAARLAWDMLPERLRSTKAMLSLRTRIDSGIGGATGSLAKR